MVNLAIIAGLIIVGYKFYNSSVDYWCKLVVTLVVIGSGVVYGIMYLSNHVQSLIG